MPVTTIIVIFDSPVHGPLVSPAVGYGLTDQSFLLRLRYERSV